MKSTINNLPHWKVPHLGLKSEVGESYLLRGVKHVEFDLY